MSDTKNNSYQNTYSNIDSRLIRCDNKLYYNYLNEFFKYGTYEISENVTKRIYWEGPSLSPHTLNLDCVYQNKLVENKIEGTTIKYYDFENYKYKPLLSVKSKKRFIPKDYFIVDDVIYYLDSDNSFYIQKQNDIEFLFSYKSLQLDEWDHFAFEGSKICFVGRKYINDDVFKEYICRFDVKKNKLTDKILRYEGNFCYEGQLKGDANKRFSCDITKGNAIYGMTFYNDKRNIYSFNFITLKSKILFSCDGECFLNKYNDRVFLCVADGKKRGIYLLNKKTNLFEKIYEFKENACGFYIVDSKYLYFIGANNSTLYRVTQDGKTEEKIFG